MLEIKTSEQIINAAMNNMTSSSHKKWVSVESLKEFIISDQRDKFREACLNDKGQVKSTMSKLLEMLK